MCKKFGFIFLLIILFLTGCNKEEVLTCTNTNEADDLIISQKIVINFNNNVVNNIKMSVDSKANNDTIKDNWDLFVSNMDEYYNNKKEDGLVLSTSNNKDAYTYTIKLDVDFNKASEKVLKEYNLNDIVGKKSKIEDVKKDAKKDGFTCK